MVKSMVHAPHTSDRARPAGTASETNASPCRYASCRFIVASGLAESRGGLVAASLAVVAAGKPSEEWEARRTNHSIFRGGTSRVEKAATKGANAQLRGALEVGGQRPETRQRRAGGEACLSLTVER